MSSIANFARITNSILVARINAEIAPNFLDTSFLPVKYNRKQVNIPYNATGKRALNSLITPQNQNEIHSPQK